MGLFDLVREEQEAKKKAEESAKKDTKDAVVEEVEKVEEDKKETEQRKTGSGNLSPYSVRESCESDGYYSCSNADTEELLWNLSEDHRNGEGQRGSPGDGAKSDR